MLGGSDFDARIAAYFATQMIKMGSKNYLKRAKSSSEDGKVANFMINSAETVRIFLSNNKSVRLALPLKAEGWLEMKTSNDVIITRKDDFVSFSSDPSYVVCELSRKEMEQLCETELRSLLRPIREVALLAQAMLPGDARPRYVKTTCINDCIFVH